MRRTTLLSGLILLAGGAAAFAAEFTVTNTNSSGPGSLHQAITDANADAAQDTIAFNIPGSGVQVINVGSTPLPQLSYPVSIDGYTQPGSRPNTLEVGSNAVILIHLSGRGAESRAESGLVVSGGNTRIRGLAITDLRTAVFLAEPLGGNVLAGNFIGIDPSGQTAAPNTFGISASAPLTTIGGKAPEERNVISGQVDYGISISGSGSAAVVGNYIGTDASGTTAIPNRTGVRVTGGSPSNHCSIGGNDRASGNVISGNLFGIEFGDGLYRGQFTAATPARYATVSGNLIGTTADGQGALGNRYGIHIINSAQNTIGGSDASWGNTIAFNEMFGIRIWNYVQDNNPAISNSVLSNRIYRNGSRGISLYSGWGGTSNDPQDADTGPNNLQNYPLLTSSSIANGIVTSNGTLNSTPNSEFTIQFFADSRSLTTPGQTYLGSTAVTTDANGDAAFSVKLPIHDANVFINATATNVGTGDTSEFYYNTPRVVNISTRLPVSTGDDVLIAGFIVQGYSAAIVLRGLGPSLNVNGTPLPGTLQDPEIYLYDATGELLGMSDNWRNSASPSRLGTLAPTSDLEAALLKGLDPGAYTVVLRGKNGGTGIGLVEVYVLNGQSDQGLTNISTRGLVQTRDDVMIAGFISISSHGPARYMVRALGPSLGNAGISNPLADPTLELYDANGALIDTNDNWKDGDESSIRESGLAPQSDAESVILTTLGIGAYTAVVRGKNGTTGVALVEVYDLM